MWSLDKLIENKNISLIDFARKGLYSAIRDLIIRYDERIGELEFKVAELRGEVEPEVDETKCQACNGGKYESGEVFETHCLNPNGEFVPGYGYALCYQNKAKPIERCPVCGHIKGTKVVKVG